MTIDPNSSADGSELEEEHAALIEDSIEYRRGKVLTMRTAGATYATIADECEVSVATVRKDYEIALAAQAAAWTPERRIARQSVVLTDVLRYNYPEMMKGDKDAAVTILRALEREAKLFGLDAPQRVIADVNPVDFANETARLITRIQQIDPTTLKELTRVGHRPTQPAEVIEGEVVADPEPADRPALAAADFPAFPGPTFTAADRRRAAFGALAGGVGAAPAGHDQRPRAGGDADGTEAMGASADAAEPGPAAQDGRGRRESAPARPDCRAVRADPASDADRAGLGLPAGDGADSPGLDRPRSLPGVGGLLDAGGAEGGAGSLADDDLDGWSNIED